MKHFNILTTQGPLVVFLLKYIFFTEVVTYRDECYYLQMFQLHQMMTITNKSEQNNKNKNKLTTFSLSLSLSFYYVGSTWKCRYKVFISICSDSLL